MRAVNESGLWTVRDFAGPEDYTLRLTAAEIDELDEFIAEMDRAGKSLDDIDRDDLRCPLVEARLAANRIRARQICTAILQLRCGEARSTKPVGV